MTFQLHQTDKPGFRTGYNVHLINGVKLDGFIADSCHLDPISDTFVFTRLVDIADTYPGMERLPVCVAVVRVTQVAAITIYHRPLAAADLPEQKPKAGLGDIPPPLSR